MVPETVTVEIPGTDPDSDFVEVFDVGVVDFKPNDDEGGTDLDGVSDVLASTTPVSPSLYLIQIAPAGTFAPIIVKVCVDPYTSPLPVYGTVVMTVLSMLDVHNVESPPGGFKAGLVFALKPG